jgi:hypothetical protein
VGAVDTGCKAHLAPRHADPGPLFRARRSLVRARGSRGVGYASGESARPGLGRYRFGGLVNHRPRARLGQISSGTISMAPQGHSCTQMPQPLQKS